MDTPQAEGYPLSRLLESVSLCIEQTYRDLYWVRAETLDVSSKANGHCYLELIEKEPGAEVPKARARAMIWRDTYAQLAQKFASATGSPLVSGIKVLVRVQLRMHPAYGFSLTIWDIDPSYTLGDLARARREVLERLRRAGIIRLNRELELPPLVQQIAVISSAHAAGYGDFIRHLQENPYGLQFYPKLFPAVMQGASAPASVAQALDRIWSCGFKFQAVVIIRGGGATADLTAFDQYPLAEAAAQFPLPILSGVGHERDKSVLDEVAHLSFKTPTAVADFLIDRALQQLTLINEAAQALSHYLRRRTHEEQYRLQSAAHTLRITIPERLRREGYTIQNCEVRLRSGVQLQARLHERRKQETEQWAARLALRTSGATLRQKQLIGELTQRLRRGAPKLIALSAERLAGYDKLIGALHPNRVLRRGFSIVSLGGKAISSVHALHPGDTVQITTAHGKASANVIQVEPDPPQNP